MRRMKTLVIVPTYNEADNLRPLVKEILRLSEFNILVVDDNSPDGTGEIAEELKAEHPEHVYVLHRPGKLGLASAYITGFRFALAMNYDVVCQMDADFSHSPDYLPTFLKMVRYAHADVVIGSRYTEDGETRNWPWLRRWMSQGGSLYARLVLGMEGRDLTGGFKAFHRRALEKLPLDKIQATGYAFQVEVNYLCHKAGLRMIEVPITFVDRRAGESKMNSRIFWEALLLVWKLRLGLGPSQRRSTLKRAPLNVPSPIRVKKDR